eukprot:scaffold746_cov293-Chaetoceros_neogracile.AAC.20
MYYSKKTVLFVAATAMRSSSKASCSAFISSSSRAPAFHRTGGGISFTASSTRIQMSNHSSLGVPSASM